MPALHVQLLGGFHLRYDDAEVTDIRQTRRQSLLAYLLLHCHAPQSRRQIASLFWPDSSDSQARINLRRELHHLGKGIPDADAFLITSGNMVQWRTDAPYTLDVTEFERLTARAAEVVEQDRQRDGMAAWEQACNIYQGRLFPDCYDDWISPIRDRLERSYLNALEQLMLLLEAQRDYAAAIGYGERLLSHDPLHEPTYRRLMRLHTLNGNRTHALHVYRTCTEVLQRELDVKPEQETEAAYQRLLETKTFFLEDASANIRHARTAELVGRQTEWQVLRRTWRETTLGRARLALIAGEAGIGKTRLAEELFYFVRRQGIVSARAGALAAEGSLAYAPIVECLRAESIRATFVELDDVWLTELARLIPELLIERPTLPKPDPAGGRWQRQRLFEALAHALLADREPRLLLIDDLQWCDTETLDWLRFLLYHHAGAPLLIVGTVRSEEALPGHHLHALRLELRRTEQLTEIQLGPLDAQESAALAAQTYGHDLTRESAQQVYKITEGNSLFITELIRAWTNAGESDPGDRYESPPGAAMPHSSAAQVFSRMPSKVQAVIQTRLARLSPSARQTVGVAAVIGRNFHFEILRRVAPSDEDALLSGLDELWQRHIVQELGAEKM